MAFKKFYWHYAAIILSLVLASCTRPTRTYKDGEKQIVDSFWVTGMPAGDNILYFSYLNDSTFYSFDRRTKMLIVYSDKVKSHHYKRIFFTKLKTNGGYATLFFGAKTKDREQFFLATSSNDLYVYSGNGTLLYKHKNFHPLPLIKNNYNLYSENTREAALFGDTLISTFVNQQASDITKYDKEAALLKYVCNKDTLSLVQPLLKKPSNAGNYYANMQYFCFSKEEIALIYPNFDTLYQCNVHTGAVKKSPIGNRDYRLPQEWHNEIGAPDYFTKVNKLLVNSFRYDGIQFDENKNHIVLFYRKPEVQKDKDKLPVAGRQPMYALALDKNLQPLSYYKLPTHKYYPYYIKVPKGIAIPKFKKDINEETTIQFNVFSF